MIKNWLKPSRLKTTFKESANQFVHFFTKQTDIQRYNLAILGYSEKIADPMRSSYYELSNYHKGNKIIDLGNLINPNISAMKSVLTELSSTDLTVIVLGLPRDSISGLGDTILGINESHCCTLLTEGRKSDQLLSSKTMSFCGLQSHLISQSTLESIHATRTRHINLGDLKKNIADCEPLIRDTTHLFLNSSVVKYHDAPCQSHHDTSGITSEELCQIMHYAGFNVKCKFLAFCEMDEIDNDFVSLNTFAQALWYFINAHKSRASRLQTNQKDLIEYLVDLSQLESPLRFKHNTSTGEWWICDTIDEEKWVACGIEDYNLAMDNIIPPRLNVRIAD